MTVPPEFKVKCYPTWQPVQSSQRGGNYLAQTDPHICTNILMSVSRCQVHQLVCREVTLETWSSFWFPMQEAYGFSQRGNETQDPKQVSVLCKLPMLVQRQQVRATYTQPLHFHMVQYDIKCPQRQCQAHKIHIQLPIKPIKLLPWQAKPPFHGTDTAT